MLVDFSKQSAGSKAVADHTQAAYLRALDEAAKLAAASFPTGARVAIIEVRLIAAKEPHGT